jgi:hypothetical protein
MPLIVVVCLPFLAAIAFAIAAALHYGAAARRQARDLPNLPMAMTGGAAAGALAVLLAFGGLQVFKLEPNCLPVGVTLAGLAGEYLGGRVDDVRAALLRGVLCAVTLFPLGTALMAVLLGRTA